MNRTAANLHQLLLPIYSFTLFWLHNIEKIRKILITELVVK